MMLECIRPRQLVPRPQQTAHPAANTDVAWVAGGGARSKPEVALLIVVGVLSPAGALVVWVNPQKASANETFRFRWKGAIHRRGSNGQVRCPFWRGGGERPPVRKAA